MNDQQDKMRAAFEAWARRNYGFTLDRYGDPQSDEYVHYGSQFAWLAWQAATSTQQARIEELERDARRYRWLREQNWDEGPMCVAMWPRQAVKLGHDCPSRDRLDAAIDAEIAALSSLPSSGEKA